MSPTRKEVALNLRNLKKMYYDEKTFKPARVMDFVGITVDAECMEARLPDDKITRMRQLLLEFQNKTNCTLKQLL